MTVNTFGVDLGTSNVKIYNHAKNEITNEKNMIAIENKSNVYAVGDKAYEMYEKAPLSIKISGPIVNGVIADVDNMKALFQKMMQKAGGTLLRNSNFIIAVPYDVTEVEKRAFYELIQMSKVRDKKVLFVSKPIADAIGVGLDVNTAQGIMVVNVGADTTEISILSLGGIVLSKLIHTGGNRLDEAIQGIIKRRESLYIGRKTAETIKKELAYAVPSEERTLRIVGRDVVSGLPVDRTISSKMVEEAISEQLHMIVDAVKQILERTPPELSSDIIESGIYMTGGSSNIHLFDELLSKATELKVNVFENPDESVVRGISRIISEKQFAKLASEVQEKTYH